MGKAGLARSTMRLTPGRARGARVVACWGRGHRHGLARALRYPRGDQPVAALCGRRSVRERPAAAGCGRGQRRRRRRQCALRLRAALGLRRDVRARPAGQRESAEAATRSTPRASGATLSNSIRPITCSWPRASARGLHASTWRADGNAGAAARAGRARRALLHGGAGRDRAPVPDHHDARGGGGAGAEPALRRNG